MTIRIRCPQCGKGLKAPDRAAGRKASCPACNTVVHVPVPPASSEPLSEPVDDYSLRPPPEEPASQPAMSQPVASEPPSESLPAAHSPSSAMPHPATAPGKLGTTTSILQSGRFYCLFALVLAPLCVSLLIPPEDFDSRLARTLESLLEDMEESEGESMEIEESDEEYAEESGEEYDEEFDESQFFSLLPGRKIEGAHLSHGTWVHWLYALISGTAFVAAIWFLFERGSATLRQLLWVGFATGTFGIIFLLMVQAIASLTAGWILVGFNPIVLIFYVVKFIGYSYSASVDPNTGFLASCLGFTFGVGFCEEFSKMLPVLFRYRGDGKLDWRGACMWGLASGVGFGVAEGIMYSGDYYNGWATGDTYLVRFVSCVGLHAVWSGAAAIMIWRRREWLDEDWDWADMLATLLYVLAVPMVLHGLYDTALKKDMPLVALVTALATFGWLVFMIEWTRRQEDQFFRRMEKMPT